MTTSSHTPVRARDHGLVAVGNGNSTSFAETVHDEPDLLPGSVSTPVALDDNRTLVRLAHSAETDAEFALILRTLDRATLDPQVRTDTLRLTFRNQCASEPVRQELVNHWGTFDQLDDLVIADHDATPAMLARVSERLPGWYDVSGNDQYRANALARHPNVTEELRAQWATGPSHHLHMALAASDQTSPALIKTMLASNRIGVHTIVTLMQNANTPRRIVARYRFRDLFRRNK